MPSLRAFAISLSGNGDRADDLVQETLLRALANIDLFQPGSNLPAWLFTILRNLFRSDYRKRRREVEDADGSYAKTLKTQPAQGAHLEFEEFRAALDKLPQDQREALIFVGASGFSYEDAAAICGCAVGTIKSRVNRARPTVRAALCRRRRRFRPRRHRARGHRRQRRLDAGSIAEIDLIRRLASAQLVDHGGMLRVPERLLADGLQRRRELLGAISLRHVDHGFHRRGQLVYVAHIGEISLRRARRAPPARHGRAG